MKRTVLYRIRVIATWANASYSHPASGLICLCIFTHIFSCLQESEGESHLLPNETNFTWYNTSRLKNHYYSYLRCTNAACLKLYLIKGHLWTLTTQTSIPLVGYAPSPADLLQVLKSNLTSSFFTHNILILFNWSDSQRVEWLEFENLSSLFQNRNEQKCIS